MRVHQVINSFATGTGGAELLARRLHLGLLQRGVEAHLTGLAGSVALPRSSDLALPSAYAPGASRRLWRHLAATVRPGDVIHAHLFPTVAYLAALRRLGALKGAALLFTEHNTSNRRRNSPLGRLVDRRIYRALDEIVAISEGTSSALTGWLPELAGRVSVVQNGVELPYRHFRRRCSEGTPRIVSLGNLRYNKNYKTALAGMAALGELDFLYQIAGEGPDRAALQTQIDALGLSGKVELLGYVEDPKALLEQADIFLMPSIVEGFGLAAVEAMNAGLPVVAGKVAGLSEVVGADGRCGILVDPTSPEAIAAAVQALIGDPERRLALGENAFARSFEFDESAMVDGYCGIYRSHADRSLAR